jgi:DNA polymerase-3 subunit epsilon
VAASADPRVVYLDTETTGFGPRAEIVDVAVIGPAGETLFDSLVRPTRRIPAAVIAVHGITDADVAEAPGWCDLYDDLRRVLEGRRIVVYNVTFDKQMVVQSCAQYALPAPAAEWDCAMKKYAGYHGSWDPIKRWFRFQKLERAVLAFGAEPGGHRAAADALACRTVVHGMAATPPPAAESEVPQPGWRRAAPVASWPALAPAPASAATADWQSDALVRWARAAREFLLLLESVPADLGERPGACGVWSAREVAAHCAGWEWEAVRRLRLAASRPDLPGMRYDVDGFNAASVAVRARMSWATTLDDLAKATAALATVVVAAGESAHAREWLTGRAADFEEHAAGLRRWLATATPPGRPAADRGRGALRLETRDSLA